MRAAERGAAGGRAAARGRRRARPAAHPGRDGTVRGGLRRHRHVPDPRRLRHLARRGARRLRQGPQHLARRTAGHRPAGLVVGDGDGRAGRLRRLRGRDRAGGCRAGAQGRRQRLEDQAGGAGRALAHQDHRLARHRQLAQPDQRRADRRVGARAPRRALPARPAHHAPAARAARAAGRAAADAALAAVPRGRGAPADGAALHRAVAGRRGRQPVRLAAEGEPGARAPAPAAAARPPRRAGGIRSSRSTRCTSCAAWPSTRWARCAGSAPPWC